MTAKLLEIGTERIPLEDYAIVANGILGIKGTGKSVLAKTLAEQLLDFQVQPVIFDPIGVWRHLRRPAAGRGGRAFKVVVAGGQEPDLPLTVESAPEVVRAAIRENVPLVIDLYDKTMSKGDWRKIVRSCCRVLLYENTHLIRHVFLEEASEFVPQTISDGETYAEVEKLVRMGGNTAVGVTIINQRAQEVNKAVLELCDNLFLMRQRGSHAITSLRKWMDKLAPKQAEQIAEGLPDLGTGDVWIFTTNGGLPALTRGSLPHSFHPDRKKPELLSAAGAPVDLGDFVQRMSGELKGLLEQAKENDPVHMRAEIRRLQKALDAASSGAAYDATAYTDAHAQLDATLEVHADYAKGIGEAGKTVAAKFDKLTRLLEEVGSMVAEGMNSNSDVIEHAADLLRSCSERPKRPPPKRSSREDTARAAAPAPSRQPQQPSNGALNGPQQKLLDSIAWWDSIGITSPGPDQSAYLCNYSPTSGGYTEPRAQLRRLGLIEYEGKNNRITAAGRKLAQRPATPPTNEDLHRGVLGRLDGPSAKMLRQLLDDYPEAVASEDLAHQCGYALTSGGFTEPRGLLKRFGLVTYPSQGFTRAADFLFPI